ncbi:MAG: hypothetical protein ABI634_13995 [Acidobacteriota bacterium]
MASARFIWKNVTLEAASTVSASTEATGYPATNAKNSKRGLPWRSATSTANQTFTALFSSRLVTAVALVNWKGHTGGTIKAEYRVGAGAYSNFGGGTGLFTLTSPNRTRLIVLYSAAGVTATEIRITFTQPGSPVTEYVEIGVPFIADSTGYFEPTAKLSNDRGIQPVDPSLVRAAVGGQRQAWKKQKTIVLTGSWIILPRADLDTLMQVWDQNGATDPIIFTQASDTLDQTIYGTLVARPTHKHVAGNQWAWQATIEEAA